MKGVPLRFLSATFLIIFLCPIGAWTSDLGQCEESLLELSEGPIAPLFHNSRELNSSEGLKAATDLRLQVIAAIHSGSGSENLKSEDVVRQLYSKIDASAYNGLLLWMINNLQIQVEYLESTRPYVASEVNQTFPERIGRRRIIHDPFTPEEVDFGNKREASILEFAQNTLKILKHRAIENRSLNLWELIDLSDRYGISIVEHDPEVFWSFTYDKELDPAIHKERMNLVIQHVDDVPAIMTDYATLADINTATSKKMSVFFLPRPRMLYDFDNLHEKWGAVVWSHDWGHKMLLANHQLDFSDLQKMRSHLNEGPFSDQDREVGEAIYFYIVHENILDGGATLSLEEGLNKLIGKNQYFDELLDGNCEALINRLRTPNDMLGAVRNSEKLDVGKVRRVAEEMLSALVHN